MRCLVKPQLLDAHCRRTTHPTPADPRCHPLRSQAARLPTGTWSSTGRPRTRSRGTWWAPTCPREGGVARASMPPSSTRLAPQIGSSCPPWLAAPAAPGSAARGRGRGVARGWRPMCLRGPCRRGSSESPRPQCRARNGDNGSSASSDGNTVDSLVEVMAVAVDGIDDWPRSSLGSPASTRATRFN